MLISGPNGAGKSTIAGLLLPAQTPYINADDIALLLRPEAGRNLDLVAGRLMLQQMDALLESNADVAVETTLAARTFLPRVEFAQARGYQVWLLFLWLPSPELAVARVEQRVASGGHSVPEAVIRQRYGRGLSNFFGLYKNKVDAWRMYDSSPAGRPSVIATRLPGEQEVISRSDIWDIIRMEWDV